MKVVLLHALPLDARMWEPQRGALAEHEVYAPDLYRLGGDTMDDWAGAVLDHVDGDFAVVGASMGGYCALSIVRAAPARVRGLVLAGSRAEADDATPERRAGRAATLETIARDGAAGLWEQMRPRLFPEGADPLVVERAREIALEQDADDLTRAVVAIRDRSDATEVVADLEVPLLIAIGDADPFVSPAEGRATVATARDGRFVEFSGCGHLPSMEQPARFNDVVTEFFASL